MKKYTYSLLAAAVVAIVATAALALDAQKNAVPAAGARVGCGDCCTSCGDCLK